MAHAKSLWTVSTSNTKTSAIPTQYVGATEAETWDSCEGCSLRPDAKGGCYAWNGRVQKGAWSVRKAVAGGKPGDLPTILRRTPRGARVARFGAIGDPARVDRIGLLRDVATAKAAGLKPIGYTHHWRQEPRTGVLKSILLASCETLEQAAEARALGWMVSLAGPESNPGMVPCPNSRDASITCNRCGMCNVETLRKTGYAGVVFPAHGVAKRRLPMAPNAR